MKTNEMYVCTQSTSAADGTCPVKSPHAHMQSTRLREVGEDERPLVLDPDIQALATAVRKSPIGLPTAAQDEHFNKVLGDKEMQEHRIRAATRASREEVEWMLWHGEAGDSWPAPKRLETAIVQWRDEQAPLAAEAVTELPPAARGAADIAVGDFMQA
jgi:hypothetical protein